MTMCDDWSVKELSLSLSLSLSSGVDHSSTAEPWTIALFLWPHKQRYGEVVRVMALCLPRVTKSSLDGLISRSTN